MNEAALLSVKNLTVDFKLGEEWVRAVRDVSFELEPGETFGLAGESGCGKSTVALALMQLLAQNGRIKEGQIWFRGRDLVGLSDSELRKVRWKELALIFQGAMNSLNPVKRVGLQIAEALIVRSGLSKETAWKRVEDLFQMIGIRPERARDYPHEFSGGMRQRVMIAMAVCLEPRLVVADECTTALDVMIQTQIMELLKDLKARLNLSMLFINHDLSLIADICDWVGIMYAGRIVEQGSVGDVFFSPAHPYLKLLLKALPRMSGPAAGLSSIPGAPPRLQEIPAGCSFLPRCPIGDEACSRRSPPLSRISAGHRAACFKLGAPLAEGIRDE